MMKFKFLAIFLFAALVNPFFSQEKAKLLLETAKKIYASDPDSSLRICLEAEKLATENEIGDICQCKIKSYLLFTDYENAEIEIHKAIDFYKKRKDLSNLSIIYRLKWNLLGRIGEPEEARRNLLLSYNTIKDSKDYENVFSVLGNVTFEYINNKELDGVEFYFDKMKNLLGKVSEAKKYYYYQNLGIYYSLKGEYQSSMFHLFKAKEIAYKLNLLDSKATIQNELSKSYQLQNKMTLARESALESYDIAKNNNLIYEQADALKELIKIEKKQANFKEAFLYVNELMLIENKILNLEKLNNIKSIEHRLTLTKKENEIGRKNLQIEKFKVQTIQSKIRNQRQNLIIVVISFSLVFIFIVFYRTKKLNTTIRRQKIEVEQKNKEITDSITYAKRIQSAILPREKMIQSYFPDSFILYKPKDIVAGDFYWFEVLENTIFFAAADCTGHGVPGAMVSVVCHNALNRSVREFGLKKPGEILDKAREIVVAEFEKSDEDVKDGMDISLGAIELSTKLLDWAGAHNPLWILRDGELIEYKANKQPIGKFADPSPFTTHQVHLKQGDELYVFTDGFQDQFGGERGKKFKASKLKDLLLSLNQLSMKLKGSEIDQAFEEWKKDVEQLDDVCMIGIRI